MREISIDEFRELTLEQQFADIDANIQKSKDIIAKMEAEKVSTTTVPKNNKSAWAALGKGVLFGMCVMLSFLSAYGAVIILSGFKPEVFVPAALFIEAAGFLAFVAREMWKW